MLARCPTCRATFSTDQSGQQLCPACGKPLIVPAQAAPPLATLEPAPGFGGAGAGGAGQPPGTPWERRPELPLLRAWWETVSLALFEPGKLFDQARLDRGPAQAGFAVATFSVFHVLGQLLQLLLVTPQQDRWVEAIKENFSDRLSPAILKLLDTSAHTSTSAVLTYLLLAPLIGLVFLYLNAGVTHLCALLFGQNRRGFPATFAACAYAMAPAVLFAIPACGSIVGLVWTVVLTGIGLKRTHGLTTGGATAAALGPYLVFCCLGCVTSVVLGSVGASFLTGGAN